MDCEHTNKKNSLLPDYYDSIVFKYKQTLTRNEEKILFEKLVNSHLYKKEEVKNAFETLVYSNQKLVLKYAYFFYEKYPHVDLMDFIEYGNLGLIKSINNFKPEMNNKLSTYAVHHIMAAMERATKKVTSDFLHPIVCSLDSYVSRRSSETASYEPSTYGNFIVDEKSEDALKIFEIKSEYDVAMKLVNKKERQILIYMFEKEYTLKQIGRIYHLTKEGIRLKLNEIYKKIKLRISQQPRFSKRGKRLLKETMKNCNYYEDKKRR